MPAAAERERYEKHVEQWNAARPDDRLVIGKAGYATRKAKSRVDEEKKARREAERAAKKERAAKRCGPRGTDYDSSGTYSVGAASGKRNCADWHVHVQQGHAHHQAAAKELHGRGAEREEAH